MRTTPTPQVAAGRPAGAIPGSRSPEKVDAPSSSASQWLGEVYNPTRRIALSAAMCFVFLRLTGLHEVLALKLGFNTYILYLFAIPSILGLVLSGGVARTLKWTAPRYFVGFLACLIAAVPFSFWKGGSAALVLAYIRTEIIVMFLITGLVMTWPEVWRLMKLLALSAVVVVAVGRYFVNSDQGADPRLQLAGGTMANSNDYAALLELLLPFLLAVVFTPGRNPLLRVTSLGVFLYGIYLVLSTGSRGALIALGVTVLFVVWRLPFRYKIVALVGCLLVALLMIFALPSQVERRLAAIGSNRSTGASTEPQEEASLEGAESSKEGRIYLLKRSILFTLTHPLFGVGPGEFSNYEGKVAGDAGVRGAWHETHNAYTQVSSEVGIPALLFFVAALVSTFRLLRRVYRKAVQQPSTSENQQIALVSFFAMVSMVAFTSSIFFLSLAYRFYLPALAGIAVAVARAADHQWSLRGVEA